MTDVSSPPATPAASMTAAFADLIAELTTANAEQAILTAMMNCLQKWQPQAGYLIFLHQDEQSQPQEAQVVAIWHGGQVLADNPEYARRHRIADFPIARLWLKSPSAPLLVSDLGKDPRSDAAIYAYAGALGHQAMALLPLFNECYGGWQGLVAICWEEPHSYSPEEETICRFLMSVLAAHLGGLRSQRALRSAFSEAELLYKATRQLNLAITMEEALGALVLPAPAPHEAEVALGAIESTPQGTPAWLTINSVHPARGRPATAQRGSRFYLPDIPFSKLYLSSPDAPLLISDIEHDPRVDERARQIYAAAGVKSTIVMALTLHGRWVGLLNVIWRHQVALGEREQRMYHALAGHAALLLDNALMVERQRAALAEAEQKGSLLSTILQNIPVGIVLLEGPSGRPLLSNAAAAQLLGRELDQKADKEQVPQTYSMVYPGSERPLPVEELPGARALATGSMQVAEIDVLPLGKERISLESIAIPMFDESGGVKNALVVLTDLSTRKRAEQERIRLQEEIIRVQAAALAERSSPLIPITDDILVLPIIGSIDLDRGQQMLSTVLHGSSQSRARVAIIDITGVPTVDSQAASILTNAAQALRLLGVTPVLTGIRADVAQTLVSLGSGLEGIVTRSTLQAGIQYALRRLDKPAIG